MDTNSTPLVQARLFCIVDKKQYNLAVLCPEKLIGPLTREISSQAPYDVSQPEIFPSNPQQEPGGFTELLDTLFQALHRYSDENDEARRADTNRLRPLFEKAQHLDEQAEAGEDAGSEIIMDFIWGEDGGAFSQGALISNSYIDRAIDWFTRVQNWLEEGGYADDVCISVERRSRSKPDETVLPSLSEGYASWIDSIRTSTEDSDILAWLDRIERPRCLEAYVRQQRALSDAGLKRKARPRPT